MNFKEYFRLVEEGFQKKKVFHGTPKETPIEKLELQYIGTGEGFQTYGWGLYFAEEEKVADSYRFSGTDMNKTAMSPVDHLNLDQAIERAKNRLPVYAKDFDSDWYQINQHSTDIEHNIENLKRTQEFRTGNQFTSGLKPRGQLYTVHLHVHDYELLNWDAPFEKQLPFIKKRLKPAKQLLEKLSYKTYPDGGGQVVDEEGFPQPGIIPAFSQEDLDEFRNGPGKNYYYFLNTMFSSPKEASLYLLSQGVKGIKYRDQRSRKKTQGPTYNYVIFDESVIEKIK